MADTDYVAPFVLEYSYKRSLGPVLSRFFTSLRDGRIEGIRTAGGRVLVPPCEYDPDTGEATTEFVEVGPGGMVESWCWVEEPRPKHPVQTPFAWALIRLDGADTAMMHIVLAPRSQMKSGMRVQVKWQEERQGHITDIACFEAQQ